MLNMFIQILNLQVLTDSSEILLLFVVEIADETDYNIAFCVFILVL